MIKTNFWKLIYIKFHLKKRGRGICPDHLSFPRFIWSTSEVPYLSWFPKWCAATLINDNLTNTVKVLILEYI